MEELERIILIISGTLMDKPEGLRVEIERDDSKDCTTFYLYAKENMGQLIGKEGRIANALRTIIKSAAIAKGLGKVYIEIQPEIGSV